MIQLPQGYKVGFKPHPGPQTTFLSAPDDEVLFGGAAGPGKSTCLLVGFLRFIHFKEANGVVFRKNLTDMDGLKRESMNWFPMTGGVWHEQKKTWIWKSGAQLRFAAIERYQDVLKYQGHQFTYIAWDELTHWASDEAYLYMFSRLRKTVECPNGLMTVVRSTTNPGGPGEKWVRARFKIDSPLAMHQGTRFLVENIVNREDGTQFIAKSYRRFIPAKISDNPTLDRSDYERSLVNLGADVRKQLMAGLWGINPQQLFGEWDDVVHTCRPFPIPRSWKRWRGGDDGFSAPSCILWFAQEPDTKRVYVYNELYESKLLASILANRITQIDKDRSRLQFLPNEVNIPLENLSGVYDSAAFYTVGQAGQDGAPSEARALTMNKLGCNWQPCSKGPGSIKTGVLGLRELLAHSNGKQSRLVIFTNCQNIISQMSSLCHKNGDPDDLMDGQEDHAFDALRYGLQFAVPETRIVKVKWG